MRSRGLTYAAVASRLGLSEATVKRMFSKGDFTLSRVDAVCDVMGMELTDLMETIASESLRITRLTHEQEQALASDMKLLLVAVYAENRWTFDEIVEQYELSETECIRLLARLDRIRLIELLPGNKIRLRVTEDFRWIRDGPIERLLKSRMQTEFLRSAFDGSGELGMFLNGTLSPASQALLVRRLEALARDFAEPHKADKRLPIADRKNVGVVLAFQSLHRKRTPPASRAGQRGRSLTVPP